MAVEDNALCKFLPKHVLDGKQVDLVNDALVRNLQNVAGAKVEDQSCTRERISSTHLYIQTPP